MKPFRRQNLSEEQIRCEICRVLDTEVEKNRKLGLVDDFYYLGLYRYLVNLAIIVIDSGVTSYHDFKTKMDRKLSFLCKYGYAKTDYYIDRILNMPFYNTYQEDTEPNKNDVIFLGNYLRKNLPMHVRLLGNSVTYIIFAIAIMILNFKVSVLSTNVELPYSFVSLVVWPITFTLIGQMFYKRYTLVVATISMIFLLNFASVVSFLSISEWQYRSAVFDMLRMLKLSLWYLLIIPFTIFRLNYYQGPKIQYTEID